MRVLWFLFIVFWVGIVLLNLPALSEIQHWVLGFENIYLAIICFILIFGFFYMAKLLDDMRRGDLKMFALCSFLAAVYGAWAAFFLKPVGDHGTLPDKHKVGATILGVMFTSSRLIGELRYERSK